MATYSIRQFAQKVGQSDKTIRRYIKKGKTPDGKQWHTPQKKGRQYILTESDLDQWTTALDNSTNGQDSKGQSGQGGNQSTAFQTLLDDYKALNREYRETLLLQGQARTALEKDLDNVKDKYNQTATEKKQLEMRLQEIEKQLRDTQTENEKLKKRSIWGRLFGKSD